MTSHAGFIAAAFGLTAIIVFAVIGTLVADHRSLRRALARFADRNTDGDA